MSILDSLKSIFQKKDDKAVYLSGFKKSKDSLQEKSSSLKKNFKGVDDEFLEQLEIVLLESDIGVETADAICENMKKTADEYVNVSWKWAVNFVIQSMKDLYEEVPDEPIRWNENGPTVIFLEGVNGSGKTTTAAKLTAKYQAEGKKVALVAADTFRAGAIDQLDTWAERLNVPCIKGRENGDPSAAIVDGCRYAKENNIDVLLCDTAGRLQNKAGLMAELGKMNRVAGREIPGAPHNTWLVLDATTGQNGLRQAELFDAATDLSGIILTKMDGTAKGGIVIGIKQKLYLPVLFIGLGEKKEDLRPFDLDSYLYSISQGLDDAG
ncbi:signal recognition particle-docking protein FtsY [Galactobacillus timonensis]|uniref:signal recognition particle-docking protein FtsY n=1 Tax=Galactobacillus timonensis TaxID=2041840 RepID=UPI002409D9B2|nr:signal recognition particle-docking protein FtsY [Galactobacillus timonensis]MDD6679888.1 signal recognition particle-docking protein FtsY [Galactobacillus timonensis]